MCVAFSGPHFEPHHATFSALQECSSFTQRSVILEKRVVSHNSLTAITITTHGAACANFASGTNFIQSGFPRKTDA